jgi:hypothetical protein
MKDTSVLSIYPKTRIKPYDGMSVSAAVWGEAHEEHRQAGHAHDLLFHGSGIIAGLEVLANDPPNQLVFISPGAAVDPAGNVIILPEPVAYDFGNSSEGLLYLLLVHGEREVGGVEQEIKYIQNEFVIAARSSLPKRPVVELARVTLPASGRTIKNAALSQHPSSEELDLRFRDFIGPQAKQRISVAVCSLGKEVPAVVTGWDYLCREAGRSTDYQPVVDSNLSISAALAGYDMVYLSAKGTFKLDADQLKSLRAVLDGGKWLLAEAYDGPSEKAFDEVFKNLEISLSAVEASSDLLQEPFLFTAPPEGSLGHQVQVGKRVIYSTAGYSQAWAGSMAPEHASRSDIRSAHEWGLNLLHLCVHRS